MESDLHAQLKRCASAWLRAADASAVACEVTTAIPHWRADVAGWLQGDAARLHTLDTMSRSSVEAVAARAPGAIGLFTTPSDPVDALLRSAGAVNLFGHPDRAPGPGVVRRMMEGVRTVIVECKATRADFLSDRADLDRAAADHARLRSRRDRVREQLVARWEPHLRREGETLFAETDGWNFERSRLASVRAVDRDERLAREALASQVKFARMARWRIADRLFLCCPGGLVKAHEVPAGWGWIEVSRGALRVRRAAPDLGSPPSRRWRMIRNTQRGRP
jgi:hypothetical protein